MTPARHVAGPALSFVRQPSFRRNDALRVAASPQVACLCLRGVNPLAFAAQSLTPAFTPVNAPRATSREGSLRSMDGCSSAATARPACRARPARSSSPCRRRARPAASPSSTSSLTRRRALTAKRMRSREARLDELDALPHRGAAPVPHDLEVHALASRRRRRARRRGPGRTARRPAGRGCRVFGETRHGRLERREGSVRAPATSSGKRRRLGRRGSPRPPFEAKDERRPLLAPAHVGLEPPRVARLERGQHAARAGARTSSPTRRG